MQNNNAEARLSAFRRITMLSIAVKIAAAAAAVVIFIIVYGLYS
jgi:hypothetical protein